MDSEHLLRKYKKKHIADIDELPVSLKADRGEIQKIIPHRDPMLLIDRLTGLDLHEGIITGVRYIDPQDPVFAGHFPDFPVYPGSLEIEMIGQLGLCLYYFVTNSRTAIADDAQPVNIRATRITGALYLEPVLPGSEVIVIAKKLDYDGFFAQAVGQVILDNKVCCVAIGEVVFP